MSTARSATRLPRRTGQIRIATLHRSSRSSRTASASDAAVRRPPGDSGVTGKGKKGEFIDLKVTAPAGHKAVLHVLDPSVDAGGGRRHLRSALGGRKREDAGASLRPRARAVRLVCAAGAGAPRRRRAARSTTGSRRCRRLEHRSERPRRDQGDGGAAGGLGDVDRRLPSLHPALAQAARERAARERRRPPHPGPADPGPGRRDHLRIHFKNMDTLRHAPHSMHFHGVHYKPTSDGAYIPGFSGQDGNVKPGQTYTYRLTAGEDSAGVWPYHDHSPSMMASIDGGMYGMLSILGRERAAARPRVRGRPRADGEVHDDRRPCLRRQHTGLPREGRRARSVGRDGDGLRLPHLPRPRPPLDVPATIARDTQTVGPAESYRFRWREDAPGTWLYHCHVEDHMMRGMIGIYRVSR